MQWTKIDENNTPEFETQYLLGVTKKGLFKPEKVYFGWLSSISTTKKGDSYLFEVNQRKGFGEPPYGIVNNITHFIKIEDLPKVI